MKLEKLLAKIMHGIIIFAHYYSVACLGVAFTLLMYGDKKYSTILFVLSTILFIGTLFGKKQSKEELEEYEEYDVEIV